MKNLVITPNEFDLSTDSQRIQAAVDKAHNDGINKVVIPRINERVGKALWIIDKTIRLPSDMEIVLDNCYIRQIDGSMDTVFRNFDEDNVRTTLEEEQENTIDASESCPTSAIEVIV